MRKGKPYIPSSSGYDVMIAAAGAYLQYSCWSGFAIPTLLIEDLQSVFSSNFLNCPFYVVIQISRALFLKYFLYILLILRTLSLSVL